MNEKTSKINKVMRYPIQSIIIENIAKLGGIAYLTNELLTNNFSWPDILVAGGAYGVGKVVQNARQYFFTTKNYKDIQAETHKQSKILQELKYERQLQQRDVTQAYDDLEIHITNYKKSNKQRTDDLSRKYYCISDIL